MGKLVIFFIFVFAFLMKPLSKRCTFLSLTSLQASEERLLPLQGFPLEDFQSDVVERLFQNVRGGIFQVKISTSASSPKASYGTSFAVSSEGLLVTNYHVVAPLFFKSKESTPLSLFIMTQTGPLLARVVSIDLIHDLALIAIPKKLKSPLSLGNGLPRKGQKIYAIGIPKDLNVSLIEATSNGSIVYGPYEQLHMSGPINGGMSGGPTLNRRGEVIGVNVSYLLNAQNISFSIPVSYVHKLIKSYRLKYIKQEQIVKGDSDYFDFMEKQLLQVEKQLLRELKQLSFRSRFIDDWFSIAPPESMKCWSSFKKQESQIFFRTMQSCVLGGKTYVTDGFSLGDYDWQMTIYKNNHPLILPFYFFLHQVYNQEMKPFPKLPGAWSIKKKCLEWNGLNRYGTRFIMNVCLQPIPHFPSLYFMNAKWVGFVPDIVGMNEQVLMMKTQVRGFSEKGIKEYLSYYLNSLHFPIGLGK